MGIKSICILTLTTIYTLTHQYQTLVREITTPTLPTFVNSCLNLVPKTIPTLCKNLNGQESLVESVFEAFSTLIPRHPTVFRPFASQIQVAARLYIAPTIIDQCFVAPSLQESASRLHVTVHQTAPKNTASDEWAKALRLHIKASHTTADYVFRAVVEDWESVSGYVSEQIDVNAVLHGGSESNEDLPEWSGIFAGVERLTGVLGLLEHYLRSSTAAAVSIPIGAILDLVTRMLSLAKPTSSTKGFGSVRINPAIDREEREGLWDGLPRIHVASMKLLMSLIARLQGQFLPLSQGCLDQITWLFPFGHSNDEFKKNAYYLVAKLLCCGGPMLPKDSVSKLSAIILACCNDILPKQAKGTETLSTQKEGIKKPYSNGSNSNADTFLQTNRTLAMDSYKHVSGITVAANELLPLFLSHIPQAYLGVSFRSQVDRTAIITKHKDAMIASVLYPFSVNGRTLPSILPHLSRLFPDTPTVEALLRPRLPPLPASRQDPELLDLIDELEPTIGPSGRLEEVGEPLHDENDSVDAMHAPSLVESSPSARRLEIATASSSNHTTKPTSIVQPKRTLSEMLSEPLVDPWKAALATAPPPKRGKILAEKDDAKVAQSLMISSDLTVIQPNVDQNASGELEEDSDNESVPSLKMEFDSSEED